jgi:flagellar basal body-associated protein FliL
MAEEKVEKEASPEAQPAQGGGNKLVLILTGVNVLLTLLVVGVLFVSLQKQMSSSGVQDINEHAKEEQPEGEGEGGQSQEAVAAHFGRMVALEQFTVNLSTVGTVSPKYARVNISLEVATEDLETEVTSKMPQVRNTVIDLFNSKRPADLATVEGRTYLKEEIRNALNSFFVSGKISGVFFTNFAIAG